MYSARSFVGWYNGLPEHREVGHMLLVMSRYFIGYGLLAESRLIGRGGSGCWARECGSGCGSNAANTC